MPSITELPCEIVGTILGNLDHVSFLPPTLLACRYFFTSFKESHGVEASILCHQITPALLPHAVALMEASRLPRPRAARSIVDLLDELNRSPTRLAARVSVLSPPVLRSMGRTHDAIHALATGFATSAWQRISSPSTTSVVLSPTEYFRFCRAFYRVELFYTLFRDSNHEGHLNLLFFGRLHPRENEQLASVYEYLEKTFVQSSLDVVAHDVDFGEMGVDYLAVGADNEWRQGWLSHGVEFVYNLTIADTYDAKHRMLNATSGPSESDTSLPEALKELLYDDENDGRKLAEYSDAELHAMAKRCNGQAEDDADRGPFEAWREANADHWLEDSCMRIDVDWLRERAYVFWDENRPRNHQDGFGEDPGDRRDYTKAEHEDMLESFDERSKVWQKGGKGYWSRDDTSRIIWPRGAPPSF